MGMTLPAKMTVETPPARTIKSISMTDSPLTSVRIVHYQRYESDEGCASGELPIL
jgi:hypothetical protein